MTAPRSRIVPMLGAPLVAVVIAALCAQSLYAGGGREGERVGEIVSAESVETQGVAPSGFAVVELFTSEGCSSCPPADDVLAQIARRADTNTEPVYAVAWHVDYWDYLGWKDPYGSSYASQRQRDYAKALSVGVYTPQAIVNGNMIASHAGDAAALQRQIADALSMHSQSTVSLGTAEVADGVLTVEYSVDSMPSGSDLLVLVVEGGLAQDVTAGENRGRHLIHENVVRGFSVANDSRGVTHIRLPDDLDPTASTVVAILQDRRSMKVVAATKAVIGDALSGISGTLVNSDGSIASGVRIYICNDFVCVPTMSDEEGTFAFDGIPAGTYLVKTQASDGPPVASVALRPGERLVLEAPITLPRR